MGRCWGSGLGCVSVLFYSIFIQFSPILAPCNCRQNEIGLRLTYRLGIYRCAGPRRQCPKSRQLLLCRGAGLGRGEPGAVHLAQLFQYGAIERLAQYSLFGG